MTRDVLESLERTLRSSAETLVTKKARHLLETENSGGKNQ